MSQNRDPRLPVAGTSISRKYKETDIVVVVGENDFEYLGTKYTSLSKIAALVCGQKAVNGFSFFKLGESAVRKPRKAGEAAPEAPEAAPEATPVVPAPAPVPAAPAAISLGDVAAQKA